MKIILVSDFNPMAYEQELLVLLFNYGLDIFHLRKRNYTENEIRQYLDKIPVVYHNRIVLHSHFHLIQEYNLKGAHFTKLDPVESVNGIIDISSLGHISFSVHSIQEIKKLQYQFDYLFFSPVFNSISNVGYNSKIKINSFKKYLNTVSDRPEIIALGGVNDSKVELLFKAKFDGFGLLGYIWAQYKEDLNLITALNKFKKIKNLADLQVEKSISNFVLR